MKNIKTKKSIQNERSPVSQGGNNIQSCGTILINQKDTVKKSLINRPPFLFALLAVVSFVVCIIVANNRSARRVTIKENGSGISIGGNAINEKFDSGNARIAGLLTCFLSSLNEPDTLEDPGRNEKIIDEINILSREICNDENLPDGVWISPKIMGEDINKQKNILIQLQSYCFKVHSSTASVAEKREFLELKIRLLKDRIDAIKEYNNILVNFIDQVKFQIETAKNSEIADGMKKQLAIMEGNNDDATPDTENDGDTYSDVENDPSHYKRIELNKKQIEELNGVISNYRHELANL
jgi:hypothetical protein